MNSPSELNPDICVLVDLFFDDLSSLGEIEKVDPSSMPGEFQTLLAHNHHMTVTVEKYHGCPVQLEVLSERFDDQHYSRKILLRRTNDGGVVQFGIVRLALGQLDENSLQRIRSKETPLGRILIENDVMRTVKLDSTWKIIPSEELARHFEIENMEKCFGRTALIFCNDEPAIELLEIVVS